MLCYAPHIFNVQNIQLTANTFAHVKEGKLSAFASLRPQFIFMIIFSFASNEANLQIRWHICML